MSEKYIEKYIKNYFWRYPQVIILDIKNTMLVFDESIFLSEAKNILYGYFSKRDETESHFAAFQAYLLNYVNVGGDCARRVNMSMQVVYKSILDGNEVLNQNTKFSFSGTNVNEALEGIFTAYHETTLRNKNIGRFDVSAVPLSYDSDNLIIRLTYYKKDGVMTKLLEKDPPVDREALLESKKIKEIFGDSNEMVISLFDGQALLKVTPYTTKWVLPQ